MFPVRCDLRQESDIMEMFQVIRSKYARLDVCVNNAGVVQLKTITEGTTEEWKEAFDVRILRTSITHDFQHYTLYSYSAHSLQ